MIWVAAIRYMLASACLTLAAMHPLAIKVITRNYRLPPDAAL